MEIRKTARALLFDPSKRLLLMRIQTPHSPGPDNPDNLPFWVTVGGQVEPGEDFAAAIRREIAEETGITNYEYGKPVWHGQQILGDGETPKLFDETFIICYTEETSISTAHLTEEEHTAVREYRWWTAADIVATTELIFPPILPQLIQPVAAGILPDKLMEIPLTLSAEHTLEPSAEPERTPDPSAEHTLDPADWEDLRRLGHRMVDDMMDYLRTVRDRPAWQPMPKSVIESMRQPLPRSPKDAHAVYEDFLSNVLPYNKNNIHPRFWSWVEGGGTPFGMLADMLASGMNPNLAIGDHAPVYVERQVLDWCKEIFGFPQTAGGILTSGASMANITALVVARNQILPPVVKQQGLRATPGQPLIYGSTETHNCVVKGTVVIGIGSDNFRKVPVDNDYRIRLDALQQMIREDRAAGHLPFCIVGNAGTVNTGAIDDLAALGEIAKTEQCWFHIDGAFGAVPFLLPEFGAQLKGLEAADSISFDFHKWFYVNYDAGAVLIRDGAAHRDAYSSPVSYLAAHERGLAGGPEPLANYGMELSRGFRALKVWMLLKQHGIGKYEELVRQNIHQAQYLAALIAATPELELIAPVPLNIVCYRYAHSTTDDKNLNALNKELLQRLQEQGIATPSYTVLDGRYTIRVAITNHRSTRQDFDCLVEASVRLGKEIEAGN